MSTTHVRPGDGRHHHMIDGDHVAKAAVRDAAGAFEVFEVIAPAAPMAPPHVSPWSGVLFLLPPDRPLEDSMAAIRSVTGRHGVALAGA